MEKRREWKEEKQFVAAIQGRRSILEVSTTHPPASTAAGGGDHKHINNYDQEEVVEKLYPEERPEQQAVKLAATALSLNIRLKSADMPFSMQERALLHTTSLLAASPSRRPNLTLLARSLKKEFDGVYGPAWHCVVGKSFGSFVTHTPGGFVYFSTSNQNQNQNQGSSSSSSSSPLSFLLFKTEVHLVAKTTPLPATSPPP